MTAAAPPGPADGRATVSFRGQVLPDWIDANGHMNVGFYDVIFDAAEKAHFEGFGIDEGFIRRTGLSYMRLERLVVYSRELMPDAPIEVRSRMLWSDGKRIHHFHELWNTAAGYRAAHADALSVHVDLTRRRSAPLAGSGVAEAFGALLARQSAPPWPEGALTRVNGRRAAP